MQDADGLGVRGAAGRIAILLLLALGATAGTARAATPRKVDFNRDIRPLLSENCFQCHGPDENKRKGNLRLDQKASAFAPAKSGEIAIVAGEPAKSEMIRRIATDDADDHMPPAKTGKKLSPEQIELMTRWVSEGGVYLTHWAFTAATRPALPEVVNKGWARNELDYFVLADLEEKKLSPSPEADKATLIRRLALDIVGLPPTPAEVDAFLSDASPQAYEKVVDRLLASPQYGERMAMQWLDGARYADSNGYQADYERFQWPWRDWVINSFNNNKPFDQFTVEQIAGDLLPNATQEQKVATGFNRNHRINTEGGVIAEEWRVETVIDRVETTSAVWLGLTMGCCRCHDHKYDPISQKEFYQFYAFFNNVDETGSGQERPVNHPPLLALPRPADEIKLKELDGRIAAAEQTIREQEAQLAKITDDWEKSLRDTAEPVEWVVLAAGERKAASGATLEEREDKSIFVSGVNAPTDTYSITATAGLKRIAGLRLEALPEGALAGKGPGRSENGNIVLTDVKVQAAGRDVKIKAATADFSQNQFPVANAIDADPRSGWAIFPSVGVPHAALFELEPVALEEGAKVTVVLSFQSQYAQHQLGHFRLSLTDSKLPQPALPDNIAAILKTPADQRSDAQKNALRAYVRATNAGELGAGDRALAEARKAKTDFEQTIPSVMVMQDRAQTRETFVLQRGQYDKHGEKVTAQTPAALAAMPAGAPANRLGLAQWIVDPANPLTARVAVNRFWERFFGVGLVKTSENFGSQAEWPSHPELLDWLATEFVRLSWDMKAMQKTIVMSATYRQSSKVSAEMAANDPENRMLARGPRFRIQAETVRDQALAIAGLLVEKVGGPSVRPYQPQGIWDELSVYGNLRNYTRDAGEGLYRRSLYTIWKRTAAPPDMMIFDAPGREICVVRRSRTNTPLQALALLNEVTFVEASRVLAQKMMTDGGASPDERITYAFRRATGRVPTDAELRILARGLERNLVKYRVGVDAARALVAEGDTKPPASLDASELAAYTLTASVILNLDETITKE